MTALLTVAEAAESAKCRPGLIRKAIHATDPHAFPPPLRAKRRGTATNAPFMIRPADLLAWVDSWPDA